MTQQIAIDNDTVMVARDNSLFGRYNALKFASFTVEDIYESIKADEEFKKDIVIHPTNVEVSPMTGKLKLNGGEYGFNDWSLTQFCSKMNGLTPKYYASCPNYLKAENANYWYSNMTKQKSSFLWRVRTGGVDSHGNELGMTLRGMATEKYKRFDDIQLMDILLRILREEKKTYDKVKIANYHRNDGGFHLKLLFGKEVEIGETRDSSRRKRNDTHYKGLVIENSETGRKSIRIKPFVWRQICSNGLIAYDFNDAEIFKQRHIGIEEDEIYINVATAMSRALDATDTMINKLIKAKESGEVEEAKAIEIIERYSKECKYDKKFVELVKEQYKKENKNTFGIVQAFTRAVQDFEPYKNVDDRVRVEQDAGKLLNRLTA